MLYAVIDVVLRQGPFPSVADGFYLGGHPVLAVALMLGQLEPRKDVEQPVFPIPKVSYEVRDYFVVAGDSVGDGVIKP